MLVVPDERAFIQQYLDALSSRSVRFGQDYCSRTLPSPLRLKRAPPAAAATTATTTATTTTESQQSSTSNDTLEVTIKILKPASQMTIGNLSPSETVSSLKQRIYQLQSSIPVNRQKLLLKGKVLTDTKTLQECGLVHGATLHLMITNPPKPAAAAAAEEKSGRFGLSLASDQKLNDDAFWTAVRNTVSEQFRGNEHDANIVIEKMKHALLSA